MAAPEDAVCRNDMTAVQQLELWKTYAQHWCEHKPSVTISVKENEWNNVGTWCWNNFKYLSGVSFLPHSDHTYKQAPYQDSTKEEYASLFSKMPENVDWNKLSEYEQEDNTLGSQTYNCSGDVCEVVDIVA